MKILICEDELKLSENLAVILTAQGFSAAAAAPDELQYMISAEEPDAVLLNDRYISCRSIIPEDTVLIITSANSSFRYEERPCHIIIKPYDGFMLEELLNDIFYE